MSSVFKNGVVVFNNKPSIIGYAAVGCEDEKQGPLGQQFDMLFEDPLLGLSSWEEAESELQKNAVKIALEKSKIGIDKIDILFAGDLLNQCVASTFGILGFSVPFIGVYGACSTMALTIINASIFIDNNVGDYAVSVTSSHFCSAEKQFRFPLDYGGQRTPTSQWTATASGAVVITNAESEIKITRAAIGKVIDLNITDVNNMGAAMAPAAADTIKKFLTETNTSPKEYDMIFTGDLGVIGSTLLYELLEKDAIDIKKKHKDCGLLLYDRNKQDVHAGGSGCGCSASVLCTHILNSLKKKEYKKILFCATGALLSATSAGQGKSIPGIAHLVEIISE